MSNGYDQLTYESLVIGRVEEVSPSIVTVAVDIEAPHGTSFAHGTLQRFPRVNGFVVLPCEDGAILAIVLWIGIDEARANRAQPPDVLGLPTPRRSLRAVPLGLLRSASEATRGVTLERGALLFPSVGDPVRLPTAAEAAAAVPAAGDGAAADGYRTGLMLGSAPMAANSHVVISANRLFGRHLAILGNTGSGKSCSLTHLLRESALHTASAGGSFRAVILDLNGEYGHAFDDLPGGVPVRRYTIGDDVDTETTHLSAPEPGATGVVRQLRVPYWLWNYREWHAFADPSGRSQAPVLRQALHMLRTSTTGGLPAGVVTLVMGRRTVREFQNEQIAGANTQAGLAALDRVSKSCATVAGAAPHAHQILADLRGKLAGVLDPKRGNSPAYPWAYQVAGPDAAQCQLLAAAFDEALTVLGVPDMVGDVSSVDSPTPFDAKNLVELLVVIAVSSGADVSSWIAPMQDRLAVAMSDQRLVRACGFLEGETLDGWIESLLGTGTGGQITVLDLSLVPAQAQQVVASVVARVLLETLERHRRVGPQVPVILAVEEAHALIRRRSESSLADGATGMTDLCRESFERVGREGRKFGLSLVISSQRPSEVSETTLSQCNSYLIHRIVNSRDQDFVRRLVPDNLGNLLNEIASFPARTALLMGAASEIPVMVEVAKLDKRYRPDSADPDFEGAWQNGVELRIAEVTRTWGSIEEDPDPSTGLVPLVPDQPSVVEPPF